MVDPADVLIRREDPVRQLSESFLAAKIGGHRSGPRHCGSCANYRTDRPHTRFRLSDSDNPHNR
jgi:hypothetical protein